MMGKVEKRKRKGNKCLLNWWGGGVAACSKNEQLTIFSISSLEYCLTYRVILIKSKFSKKATKLDLSSTWIWSWPLNTKFLKGVLERLRISETGVDIQMYLFSTLKYENLPKLYKVFEFLNTLNGAPCKSQLSNSILQNLFKSLTMRLGLLILTFIQPTFLHKIEY